MYLIHMTVLRFCYEAFTRHVPVPLSQAPGWAAAMLLTIAVTTFLFAELNYRYLETPLRLRGRRVAARIEAALQQQQPSRASQGAPARKGPAQRG
jgi:peptidoglycan/LPS O-acetylase OafA/YrhL